MAGPEVIHQYGLAADRPAASPSNEGVYYTASDTAGGTTYRSNGTTWDTIAAGAGSGVTAHSALSGLTSGDDHTQYQKESEKDQNNGYAGLDVGGLVPDARIAITITRDTELAAAISGIQPGTPQGTFLLSGGQVTWIGPSDYTYHLAAGTGYINGVSYSWAAQNITLDAADATDDRIDVIGVDDTSTVFKLTGTPAANPSEPVVEPDSQLALTRVLVVAASSTPTTNVETVYTEGAGASAEWNGTTSGATWSLVSVTNPRSGTKCIRGTNLTAGSTVTLQRGSGSIDPNAFTQLIEYLRFTSAWANNRYLLIWLALNGVKQGNALIIRGSPSTFGLDGANTTDYQAVIVPILQFAIPAGTLINQVVLQDVGGAISFGIDDVQFIAVSGQTQTGGGLDQAQADARYQQLSGKGVANGYASLDGSGLVPDAQIPAAIARDSEVTSAISTHAGLSDPHTGYQKESEKGSASGYAGLGANSLVPVAQLGTGTPDGTKFLRDDQTYAVPPGSGALTVQEIDGTPIDTAVTIIRVTNGKLTDNGAGDVTLDLSGAGGGGAPDSADYWVETANGSLSGEVVVGTTGIHAAAYASRNAAAKAGRLFLPSDGYAVERDTGAAWAPWGPIFPLTAPPASAGFTWVNQDTSTVSDDKGSILLTSLTGGASDMHALVKSTPATPWTVTIGFLFNALTMPGNAHAGLCYRQSSDGKLHRFGVANSNGLALFSTKQSSATVFSAHYLGFTQVGGFSAGILWLRIADNGTNRICSWSADKQNWLPFHTIGRTDFLTADQYGFYCCAGTSTAYVTILSLEVA